MKRSWRLNSLSLLALVALAASGCVSLRQNAVISDAVRDDIYHRAEVAFTNVILFKPLAGSDTGEKTMAFKLAPLILKETSKAPRAVAIITNQTPVFVSERSVQIHGRAHQQLMYYWRGGEFSRNRRSQLQGVRITLDAQGSPAIWEILRDDTGANLIFVAASVEAMARAYGEPLPKRKFAVERVSADTANMVVPRVIGEGPVPMGPIVYERGGSTDVQTVICRCMPSQAKQVVEQVCFRLKPIEEGVERHLLSGSGMKRDDVESWLESGRLDRQLRLPKNF